MRPQRRRRFEQGRRRKRPSVRLFGTEDQTSHVTMGKHADHQHHEPTAWTPKFILKFLVSTAGVYAAFLLWGVSPGCCPRCCPRRRHRQFFL
jgi:hypothetical protein